MRKSCNHVVSNPPCRYEVVKKRKACVADMAKTIAERFVEARGRRRVQCGIIYCLSRNECERIARELEVRHLPPQRQLHRSSAIPTNRRHASVCLVPSCMCCPACQSVTSCVRPSFALEKRATRSNFHRASGAGHAAGRRLQVRRAGGILPCGAHAAAAGAGAARVDTLHHTDLVRHHRLRHGCATACPYPWIFHFAEVCRYQLPLLRWCRIAPECRSHL